MDHTLLGFVRLLRAAGADVSVAETIDAARAMALVGYASRQDLKAALGVSLAKSAEERLIHDQVFERYFGLPAAPIGVDAGDLSLDLALARAAAELGVDDIRFSSQISYFTQALVDKLGLVNPPQRAEVHKLARALVEQRFEVFGRPATEAFMTEVVVSRPLGRLSPPDMARMKTVVARLARRLAQRHARRRRVRLHHQLDLRRTLRANAGHDAVPVELHFKHRRRDRPRFVVLCDVSGSVAGHVRFLLLFLYALHGTVGDLRSFVFSNRLVDVSGLLATQPFDEAMATILREVGTGATDYGQALLDLQTLHGQHIDHRSTLLILGDGRSNHADPRLDLLAELAQRAKRVVWLCPEPPGRWGSGDSCLLRYRPLCTQVSHCANVNDLERAIDDALQAYA